MIQNISKIKLTLLGGILLMAQVTNAQIKIGGTAGTGDPSSVLELQSTTQGLLLPRLTTTQRNAITSPATGLVIYNTTTGCQELYQGSVNGWYNMCSSAGTLAFTNCGTAVTGTAQALTPISGVTITLNYVNNTGQTAGMFSSGTVSGVSFTAVGGSAVPLTASNGSITLTATGTPAAAGTINVPVVLAGTACSIPITVGAWPGNVPVACGTAPGCTNGVDPTTAVNGDKICWGGFTYMVVTTTNGRLWLDRNLGAQQAGTLSGTASATDTKAMGDLYQWGRLGDGHQCSSYSNGGNTNGGSSAGSAITSPAGSITSSGVGYTNGGLFISTSSSDWTTITNSTLWDSTATGGPNNPCPLGWRVPSMNEWWVSLGLSTDVFTSPLKLSKPHYRKMNGGSIGADAGGRIWSVTQISGNAGQMQVAIWNPTATGSTGYLYYPINNQAEKGNGLPVRCIKN